MKNKMDGSDITAAVLLITLLKKLGINQKACDHGLQLLSIRRVLRGIGMPNYNLPYPYGTANYMEYDKMSAIKTVIVGVAMVSGLLAVSATLWYATIVALMYIIGRMP